MSTYTTTYTETDIAAVFRHIRAELYMIADSTGLGDEQWALDTAYDLTVLAVAGLIDSVHVMLEDYWEREVRANVYIPSSDAASWTAQRPAGCLWPWMPTGSLRLIVEYSYRFSQMTDAEKAELHRSLRRSWMLTSADLSHATLTPGAERTFVSNGYGVRRLAYS